MTILNSFRSRLWKTGLMMKGSCLEKQGVTRMTMKLTVMTGSAEDFFDRGKEFARKLDKGEEVEPECIISFEDPQELLELITTAKMNIFKTVKSEPGSIAEIARRLHRDRSAVTRDINKLADDGLVSVEVKPFRGHGRMKVISAAADKFN
jgi:predicted transcriptional regulator